MDTTTKRPTPGVEGRERDEISRDHEKFLALRDEVIELLRQKQITYGTAALVLEAVSDQLARLSSRNRL